jgi:hypothetical protein
MKFAKWAYLIAGIYGLIILIPQYFLEVKNGIDYPPPINHPEYYYGFIGIAVAWQIAFLIISRDPKRFHLLMIASILEKYTYGIATVVLFLQSRVAAAVLVVGSIDLILGTLFIIAYFRVKKMAVAG